MSVDESCKTAPKTPQSKESHGIFLQAIDQHYEKGVRTLSNGEPADLENSDQSNFFEDYEQCVLMKQMVSMLENTDISTDSDSLSCNSKNLSETNEEEKSPKSSKTQIRMKHYLNENWEKSIESFKKSQHQNLFKIAFSNHNSPYVNRARAYSMPVPKFGGMGEVNAFVYSEVKKGGEMVFNANPYQLNNSFNFFQN